MNSESSVLLPTKVSYFYFLKYKIFSKLRKNFNEIFAYEIILKFWQSKRLKIKILKF